MGANGKKHKVVPAGAVPQSAVRIPRRLKGVAEPGEAEDQHPMWRLSLLDHEFSGAWSWSMTDVGLIHIVEFLTQMERLTWREVRQLQTGGRRRGALHKNIPVDHLCGEAQRRLRELELDDFDEMFRFRTGNMERLWGVLLPDSPRVFYPVWWDPDHKICPGRDAN